MRRIDGPVAINQCRMKRADQSQALDGIDRDIEVRAMQRLREIDSVTAKAVKVFSDEDRHMLAVARGRPGRLVQLAQDSGLDDLGAQALGQVSGAGAGIFGLMLAVFSHAARDNRRVAKRAVGSDTDDGLRHGLLGDQQEA